MSCTKEEIEQKRLAALQKRQSIINTQNSLKNPHKLNQNTSNEPTNVGPMKGFASTSNSVQKVYHPYARPLSNVVNSSMPVGKVVSGTIYLISEGRFEVNPSEFCTPLINIFKTIPSKSYDPKSKLWNFSIEDYDTLMSKVAPLAPHIVLGPLPQYVLKILSEDTMDPNNIDLSPIEATLRHKLMPFQEEGVRFAIARRGRCMIADDMGLGKTFQALAVASYYRHNWPLLIVTTSSMRETWQSKIHELLPSVPLMNIVTLTTSKDAQLVADKQTEVVIVSFKITTMHSELLKSKKFGVVIIDESHYLKSGKARCTVSLQAVSRGAARVVLLSGTPALSRPAELYTQLQILHHNLFASYTEYGKRYCDGKQTNFGWDMTGQSNLTELQIILQKKFLIRRTKEQVLTMLQGKTRETVLLDETLLQYSKEDESELSKMAASYSSRRAADKHAALITYFSETARLKIPAICKYIRQVVREESGKFLVFAHHKNVIDAVCSTLDEESIHYICITGSTPTNIRAELVGRFQAAACCRCGVLSLTAAGAGLTLTAAALVLFAELHWNPGVLTQAESRAHRLGQLSSVRVRYLLAPRSADTHIWPMLQGKLNVLNDVGLSRDNFDNTVMKLQDSKNKITEYLTPNKNKNDYIPGTNIRKDSLKDTKSNGNYGNCSKTITNSENDNNCGRNKENSFKTNENCSERGKSSNDDKSFTNDDGFENDDEFIIDEELEKSFLDDCEGDELLATLDL